MVAKVLLATNDVQKILSNVGIDYAVQGHLGDRSAASIKLPILAKPKWMLRWEVELLENPAPTVAPQVAQVSKLNV